MYITNVKEIRDLQGVKRETEGEKGLSVNLMDKIRVHQISKSEIE